MSFESSVSSTPLPWPTSRPATPSSATITTPYQFKRARIDLGQAAEGINTIPELIEFNARENGDLVFCEQAFKTGESTSISHRQLKQAIQNCRRHLVKTVSQLQHPSKGSDGKFVKGAPIALLGESNAVLLIYLLTMVGMGVPVLLLSARLSPMAVRHLLSETNAAAIIASAKLRTTTAEAALREAGTEEETLPLYDQVSLGVLLEPHTEINEDKVHVPGYYIDETDRTVMILHSSGTTGLPKAIFTSHQYLLSFTTCHELPYNSQTEQPCLSTLPLYHGFGLIAPLLSMGVGMPFCIPSSSGIPTGRSIADLLRRSGASSLITVPSILEEISLLPGDEGIRLLQDLSFVTFGGGQIKPSVGQTLSGAGVRLVNHYGTTESGPLAPLFIPGSDYSYQYFRLRKDIKLHVAPAPDAADGVPRFSLTTYPPGWGVEFLIQDQLVQNPLCPGSDFNAVGRNDAVIVLATGEKVLPSILETQLLNDERLSAVVAFGDGQFEIGIIVQPGLHVVVQSPEAFKQDIWPLIQRANEDMDAQGRVSSLDLVIYVPPNQTLPRSDKGSIMRREVIHHFEPEINKIYQDLEQRACDDNTTRFDMNMLEDQLQDYIQTSLGWRIPEGQWSQDDDLFELGMDSLQALQLRRQLLGAVPSSGELGPASVRVTRDFVYTHPSISQIAKALRGSDGLDDDSLVINNLLAEFTGDTPYNTQLEDHNDSAILLTGTTGSLGAHILAKLVSLSSATRIVCLLRPQADTPNPNPVIRLREALSAKGLNIPDRAWSRIEVIESDMAKPNLGLSKVWYAELRSRVTHIVHAAWPMDFKRKVYSFRHALQSLQNLILLAEHAREDRPQIRPRLVFVSSIAVVGQYSNVTGESLIPEVPMTDSSCTNHIGYAQAKLICERMLEDAGSKNKGKIETTYVRVGQMSGSSATGFWNEKEHFPALVAASQAIGKLPKLRGTLSWIPVDHAASVILDILHTTKPLNFAYHLENPVRHPWNDVLCRLSSSLGIDMNQSLSVSEWVAEVRARSDKSSQATKLGEFFEEDFEHMACGNVVLDTYQTRQVSLNLRKLSATEAYKVENYVSWWRKVNVLS